MKITSRDDVAARGLLLLLSFFFLGRQKGRKYKNLAIEHCSFTSGKSQVEKECNCSNDINIKLKMRFITKGNI